jgi:hypothetical protein
MSSEPTAEEEVLGEEIWGQGQDVKHQKAPGWQRI